MAAEETLTTARLAAAVALVATSCAPGSAEPHVVPTTAGDIPRTVLPERGPRAARSRHRPGQVPVAGAAVPTSTAPPVTTTTAPPAVAAPSVRTVPPALPAAPASATPGEGGGATTDHLFDALAACESGRRNLGGPRYFGFFQFLPSTWRSLGLAGLPSDATYEEQRSAAAALVARSGWGQFPACGRRLGMA